MDSYFTSPVVIWWAAKYWHCEMCYVAIKRYIHHTFSYLVLEFIFFIHQEPQQIDVARASLHRWEALVVIFPLTCGRFNEGPKMNQHLTNQLLSTSHTVSAAWNQWSENSRAVSGSQPWLQVSIPWTCQDTTPDLLIHSPRVEFGDPCT